MSESESQSSQIEDLREAVESLRNIVVAVLVSALVVTGSLSVYLFRQTSLQARQISSQRETIAQILEEREKIGGALAQLKAFALRAPDYAPVLAKFGLKPEAMPVSTNAPAPAAAPKK